MVLHGLQTERVFATHTLPTDRRSRRIMRTLARERAGVARTNLRIVAAFGGMLVSALSL